MKSAYEIAMEKLEKERGPSKKLSDEQKERIAEIDNQYQARIAEMKLGYEQQLQNATSHAELDQIKQEMTKSVQQLEEQRENEKNKVWEES